MIDAAQLARHLPHHLARQRWFGGNEADAAGAAVDQVVALGDSPALLARVIVTTGGARWQLLVGARPVADAATVVEGKPDAILGIIETDRGPMLAYDALVDSELSCRILELASGGGTHAERARLLTSEQSNSSVVFDERLILKIFRRLAEGPNPDIEVSGALTEATFPHVPALVAAWRDGALDLAVVNEFLHGGVDGFSLALTSIHDLLASGLAPERAGGDFAPETRRLGAVTAALHLALATAFGAQPAEPARWVMEMEAQLARVPDGVAELDRDAVAARYRRLLAPGVEAGPAIRAHGDLHLGQVMRTDTGWHVLDFEGEPTRPLEERRRPSSPLRDVAGLLRSLHYAVAVGLRDYGYAGDAAAEALGVSWEARNADAFLDGYRSTEGIDALLPPPGAARVAVLDAYLLDKAVYEVAYEAAHRPDLLEVPLSAVRRLIGEGPS